MKYELMIRARVNPAQSIEAKHNELLTSLSHIPSHWGFASIDVPVPDIKHHLLATINLKRYLHKGIRGSINYQYRHSMNDDPSNDDFLEMSFNPQKVGYADLVHAVFDQYVEAFRAKLADISDNKFIDLDFEEWRKVSARYGGVYRVYPVSFYDAVLCHRAFGLTPEQVADRLTGHVESTKFIHGGVKIVVSSAVLPFEEADRLTRHVTRLLRPSAFPPV
ncbi:MAG: hypothetical protein LC104_13935 [Bacteroidales bacterium]|nr:hypothetical protein [Bacteroidales bacterium]